MDEIHPPRESASARRRSDKQAQKQLQKERKRGNRQILFITYAFVTLFLAMAGYLAYFTAVDSEKVINNSHNKRQKILAEKITKGSIYSQDGEVLA